MVLKFAAKVQKVLDMTKFAKICEYFLKFLKFFVFLQHVSRLRAVGAVKMGNTAIFLHISKYPKSYET